MTTTADPPFSLPQRPQVRRIRKSAAPPPVSRTQPMAGFEERFTDIVDYIVRITDEIWENRAVGYIEDTYDPDCAVYTSYGVIRGSDTVTRNTVAAIAAAPEGRTHHLNVAWAGDEAEGFYTAHLGFDDALHRAAGIFGPATGKRYISRFAADCISVANRIHTEWLVRDNGSMVRQVGFDLDQVAKRVAKRPIAEPYEVAQPTAGASRPRFDADTPANWANGLFEQVYNARRLDRLSRYYAADAIVHSGGGRTVQGLQAISNLALALLAAIPDGLFTVKHVCWSEETDGIIIAVRWVLAGSSARGGLLGDRLPVDRPVYMMGSSHLRLAGARIVEEWTVFDEIAVMAMAYRA